MYLSPPPAFIHFTFRAAAILNVGHLLNRTRRWEPVVPGHLSVLILAIASPPSELDRKPDPLYQVPKTRIAAQRIKAWIDI